MLGNLSVQLSNLNLQSLHLRLMLEIRFFHLLDEHLLHGGIDLL